VATKPTVAGTAVTAWQDAFRAIGAMPAVSGIAFILLFVSSFAGFAALNKLVGFTALSQFADLPASGALALVALEIISTVLQAALLAPLAIAVHRFVLLGESANRYPLEPWSSRYLRFAGFAILVKVLWRIPNLISLSIYLHGLAGVVEIVIFIAVVVITVRRVILFPAIAVDAPGATWTNAGLDTKGSSWRVAFILILTALPAVIIAGPVYYGLLIAHWGTDRWLLPSVVGAIIGVPTLCALAAAASHIYRARAEVMTLPSG
jgi:hypothetical protein